MKITKSIEYLFFETPGVIYFDPCKYIEVQPKVMTPLVINIKSTLYNPELRLTISKRMAKLISKKSFCICGIESGGSYFAATIADILKLPFILYRKNNKKYGLENKFVGTIPAKKGLITIIDDVIGEGKISTAVSKILMDMGYKVEVVSVYSYLPKMQNFMDKIRKVSLSNINSLCKVGRKIGKFTINDIKLIKKECKYSTRNN